MRTLYLKDERNTEIDFDEFDAGFELSIMKQGGTHHETYEYAFMSREQALELYGMMKVALFGELPEWVPPRSSHIIRPIPTEQIIP